MFVALLFLALFAPSALADAFLGCVAIFSLPISVITAGANTNAQCQATCAASNFKYSYFYTSSIPACYCGAIAPSASALVAGSSTSCPGYISTMLKSTWTNSGAVCYSAPTYDARDAGSPTWTFSNEADCFNQCRFFNYVSVKPASGFGTSFTCRCYNYPVSGSAATCSSSTSFTFGHSPEAAASGLARRSREEIKREQKALAEANPHCPKGYDACKVSSLPEDGYECLKSASELESCGGCRYGAYGNGSAALGHDCTALPGVVRTAVTCSSGLCVASKCKAGFVLQGGSCVRR